MFKCSYRDQTHIWKFPDLSFSYFVSYLIKKYNLTVWSFSHSMKPVLLISLLLRKNFLETNLHWDFHLNHFGRKSKCKFKADVWMFPVILMSFQPRYWLGEAPLRPGPLQPALFWSVGEVWRLEAGTWGQTSVWWSSGLADSRWPPSPSPGAAASPLSSLTTQHRQVAKYLVATRKIIFL